MSFCVILLAAGSSNRFKSNLAKPYHKIGGKTLLEINVHKFKQIKHIKKIIVVFNKNHKKIIKDLNLKHIKFIQGGNTRQISTLKALKYLKKDNNISKVLIHDIARPNFSYRLIHSIIKNMKGAKAVIPTIKIQDAVKEKFESSKYEYIVSKDRNNLFLTQTPQCFNFKEILRLHEINKFKYRDDDISLLMNLNKVKFIEGEKNNFKITDTSDFENLKNIFRSKMLVGIGFDVHRLVPKKKLYLAGLKIKSSLGTLGHSDGDPVLHALIDAILGACNMGDIGQIFSNTNNKIKNIRSTILLKKIIKKTISKNYYINNIDINIIAQKPKINKFNKLMVKNISKLCKISQNQINIKGKTTEKLGVIGKERAIASEVIISVIKYD